MVHVDPRDPVPVLETSVSPNFEIFFTQLCSPHILVFQIVGHLVPHSLPQHVTNHQPSILLI